jgi:hypothetical protein
VGAGRLDLQLVTKLPLALVPSAEEQSGPAPAGRVPKPAGERGRDRKPAVHTYAIVPASGPGTFGTRMGAGPATLAFDSAPLGLPADEIATVTGQDSSAPAKRSTWPCCTSMMSDAVDVMLIHSRM